MLGAFCDAGPVSSGRSLFGDSGSVLPYTFVAFARNKKERYHAPLAPLVLAVVVAVLLRMGDGCSRTSMVQVLRFVASVIHFTWYLWYWWRCCLFLVTVVLSHRYGSGTSIRGFRQTLLVGPVVLALVLAMAQSRLAQ